MKVFDELLKKFDLNYLGSKKHKIEISKALTKKRKNKMILLDVRTKEETDILNFNFSINIPLDKLPDNLNKLPNDKMIAIFCSSGKRASMASMYLQVNGYENVKIISESLSDITKLIKPGYILKNLKN